ncbi:MAG: N-terminal domain of oligopeptide transport permease, partial [Actinomycetota bacterium]
MSIVPDYQRASLEPEGGAPEPEARSQWQLIRRRFFRHRVAVVSVVVLLLLIFVCFGA